MVSDTSTNSKVWGQNEDEVAKVLKSKQGGVLASILDDIHVNATTTVGDVRKQVRLLKGPAAYMKFGLVW